MVVDLNIPQPKRSDRQICELVSDRMEEFYLREKENLSTTTGSLFDGLFLTFDTKNDTTHMEPVIDEYRFHCEDLLRKIGYRQSISLSKHPRIVPSEDKQLQYILSSAENLAKLIGGEEMKLVYNSLLVSEPYGENQAWHFDVHDNHAPDFPVLAMIISLKPGTKIEAKIDNNVIEIPIQRGSALAFDAKTFQHRGVSYSELNTRIYLKFAVKPLVSTVSGDAEVAPLPTCSGCKKQVAINMTRHRNLCYDYVLAASSNMTEERARNFVEKNREDERAKNRKSYHKNKKQRKVNSFP